MTMPRHAARRDAVEPELIKAARRLGIFCYQLDKPLDWLIGFRGKWLLAEVKDPSKEGHRDEFTTPQREFMGECFQRGLPWEVWRTTDDVIRFANRRAEG